MRKNILFFILVLVLSFATAPYFGEWYDKFYPQNGDWMYSREQSVIFSGFLISYLIFIIFLFEIFGSENRKKVMAWLIIPVLLFFLVGGIGLIYIPVMVLVVSFGLAFIIRKVFFKHPNPPMVIK